MSPVRSRSTDHQLARSPSACRPLLTHLRSPSRFLARYRLADEAIRAIRLPLVGRSHSCLVAPLVRDRIGDVWIGPTERRDVERRRLHCSVGLATLRARVAREMTRTMVGTTIVHMEDTMESLPLLDRAGRYRSPATLSSFHQGLPPRTRGFATRRTHRQWRRSSPSCVPPATVSRG